MQLHYCYRKDPTVTESFICIIATDSVTYIIAIESVSCIVPAETATYRIDSPALKIHLSSQQLLRVLPRQN